MAKNSLPTIRYFTRDGTPVILHKDPEKTDPEIRKRLTQCAIEGARILGYKPDEKELEKHGIA